MPNLVESAIALVWPDLPMLAEPPRLDKGDTLLNLTIEAGEILCLEAEGRVSHLYAEITRHQILDHVEDLASELDPMDRDSRMLVDDIRVALIARDGRRLRSLAGQLARTTTSH